jgi:uncharacterized protein (TIGR02453 family)
MIKKGTLEFLKKLESNNKREWFAENRGIYEAARENVLQLAMYLIGESGKFDPSVQGVDPEDCLFRIYKDTRFSRDKTPYKTNFGMFIKGGGRRTPGAGYYMHIQPGNSFVSGGIYVPPGPVLLTIRNAIAAKPAAFRKILDNQEFRKTFGELADETLKTAPKGFPRDHPAIELLKYKHYYVMKYMSDREVLSPDLPRRCVQAFMVASPFVKFLNAAIGSPKN